MVIGVLDSRVDITDLTESRVQETRDLPSGSMYNGG